MHVSRMKKTAARYPMAMHGNQPFKGYKGEVICADGSGPWAAVLQGTWIRKTGKDEFTARWERNHLLQGIRVHAKELREDGSHLAVYEVMSLCTAQTRASRTMTTMTACDAKALLLIWGVVSAQLWQHACL